MNRVSILAVIMIIGLAIVLPAQQKPGKAGKPLHVLYPTVYLGRSDYQGGPIKKEEFDRLLKQGLTSRDSLGNRYKVMGFNFNYAERNLYEDSVGNLQVLTDLLLEYCPGDTVTGNVSASIYQRIKAGDTVFIDRVKVARYLGKGSDALDTTIIAARSLKCVITQ